MPWDWTKVIGPGINAGASITNQLLGQRPTRQLNAWEQARVQAEMNRRNMLQGMAAPSALAALGYRDPEQIRQMAGQISAPNQNFSSTQPQPQPQNGGGSVAGSIGRVALSYGPMALGGMKALGLLGGAAPATTNAATMGSEFVGPVAGPGVGAAAGGGIGTSLAHGLGAAAQYALNPISLVALARLLSHKRPIQDNGPATYPGHNPDGSPVEGYGDPVYDNQGNLEGYWGDADHPIRDNTGRLVNTLGAR